jgi:predicted nuclease of predicted toxin-antitoxin system
MRFLIDQDVYALTVRLLSGLGHDVVTEAQLGLSQAGDVELLQAAQDQGRVLVTRDRDFGVIVFQSGQSSATGVVYLRILPTTQTAVHAELERVLNSYSEQELRGSFVVIEPGRHRIRKIWPGQNPLTQLGP